MSEERSEEQKRKLEEMDYSPGEDIFNREEHISLDGNGNPILNDAQSDGMPYGLDIPGSEDDDNFEQITSQLPEEDAAFIQTDEDYLEDEESDTQL